MVQHSKKAVGFASRFCQLQDIPSNQNVWGFLFVFLSRNTYCRGRKQFVYEMHCYFGGTYPKKVACLAGPPKSGRRLCTVKPHGANCEAISYPLCEERAQHLIRGCWGDKIPGDYMATGVLEKMCEPTPQRVSRVNPWCRDC